MPFEKSFSLSCFGACKSKGETSKNQFTTLRPMLFEQISILF